MGKNIRGVKVCPFCNGEGKTGEYIMPDYVKRMIAEHKELKERIQKLKKFFDGDVKLPEQKENLMLAQYHAMETYDFILVQRLVIEADDGNCIVDDINGDSV